MGRMEIRVVPYGHPDEFAPPQGLFLVGYVDDVPVASGGWRAHDDGSVEIKRMYVVPSARGKGFARQLLAELELSAKRAGHHRIILETGSKQPEAAALYRSSGYTDVPAFGFYAAHPTALHLGKSLG